MHRWILGVAACGLVALISQPTQAAPITVTFSSNGNFANPTSCSAAFPACTTANGGNKLILGTANFGFIQSTLTAIDLSSVTTPTPPNDFIIGEIDWVNNPTTNTGTNFNDNYTLTMSFTAPCVRLF